MLCYIGYMTKKTINDRLYEAFMATHFQHELDDHVREDTLDDYVANWFDAFIGDADVLEYGLVTDAELEPKFVGYIEELQAAVYASYGDGLFR